MGFFFVMGKNDLIKSAIAILVIIILAVLIANVNKLISPKVPVTSEGLATDTTNIKETRDYGECFEKDLNTVIFVYSNSCPYCNKMKPLIEELEGEGYKFYWAESSDSEAKEIVSGCFSDLLGGYVPQFICPATGTEKTGAMSKNDLKKFADNCV
jgi:hypothetical protein